MVYDARARAPPRATFCGVTVALADLLRAHRSVNPARAHSLRTTAVAPATALGDCWFSRFQRGRGPAAEGGDPKNHAFLGPEAEPPVMARLGDRWEMPETAEGRRRNPARERPWAVSDGGSGPSWMEGRPSIGGPSASRASYGGGEIGGLRSLGHAAPEATRIPRAARRARLMVAASSAKSCRTRSRPRTRARRPPCLRLIMCASLRSTLGRVPR